MTPRAMVVSFAAALMVALCFNVTLAASSQDIADSGDRAAPPGIYDFTNHGTAWVPQVRGQFKLFKPLGWGMATKAKSAGDKWVHIPVPYPARIADTLVQIRYVEFCAQSTNGADTKPVQMDLWDYAGKFFSTAISWPATNGKECFGYEFDPPVWHQDLGVSVLLRFANTTDKITLYKAWARIAP